LNAKKNIAVITCTLVLLLPFLFWLVHFTAEQVNRYHIHEKLENENIQSIIITSNEFRWVKQNEEILINNKLFDVKKYVQKGNSFTFWGVFDTVEDAITLQIKKLERSTNQSSLPYHSLLLKLLSPALLNNSNAYFTFTSTNIQSAYTRYCNPIYNNHWLQVATPPPIA
jgi:hypothetical protein